MNLIKNKHFLYNCVLVGVNLIKIVQFELLLSRLIGLMLLQTTFNQCSIM